MKVFFDLDPAVYMSGFAAQHKTYTVVYDHISEGMKEIVFQDGNLKNKWLRDNKAAIEHGELSILDTEPHLVVESESHARQAARTTIESALRELKRKYKTNDLEVQFFLTGKGNFREEVATIAKYKGNRDGVPKPVHYQAIRDYFVDHWGAYIIEGIEADDEVSIRAWEEYRKPGDVHYIIATIDKDLDQIPGWHYDYKKHVFYRVDELDGEMFFYAQCIAGDATDNIKGCYRVGITKANALVDAWFDEAIENQQDWRFYVWDLVVQSYAENMEKYPEKYPDGMTAEEAATENARLVYMMQERDELWTPPMSGSKGKA